jgi:PAS domain S-box-containing protein
MMKSVTKHKKVEDALRESEERLNRSQKIAHLGSWELDVVNNRLTWSDEVYRIFGLKPQKFKATYEAFLERVHPDDRKAVDEAYSGSLREGRDTYEIEHRVVRKSTGEIRYVHEKCEHIREKSGKIIRSIGMVHDITELKIAEEDLEKMNAILEKKITERTAELTEANKQLAQEVEERKEREKNIAARNFILDLIAKKSFRKDFFNILAENLKAWGGCGNIGIRVLAEDGGIPYETTAGFPREFLDKENSLSVIHDQCACIRVITGHFEPQDLRVITDFGSFFSNDTMAFVAGLTEAQKARFRAVCVEKGYASVAVIPIRYKNKVIAAIHLADKEKNKVPLKTVEFIESLASLVGEGIEKFRLEEKIRHAHFTQSIINSLLRLSLENISLEELLQDALEKILSVSWFSFERKGSIFLYDEKSGKLIIKAQKDLPEYLKKECDGLPVGKCICGQAALKKKTQFYDHISAEHEITYAKIPPHGHYCVPIFSKEKLLGVINIYLREGFRRDNTKESFLNSIANALAGVIEYRNTQGELLRTAKDLNEAKRLSDIGTLAATVAHELRNPLGVVRTAAYNIKRKAQNPLLDSHLENIEKKVLESEQIISNLLFYSRIKIPHYEDMKIYDLLDECVKEAQKRYNNLKVKIVRRYRPISSLSAQFDPFQIREVFMNILNNAYEAVDEKKGRIEVTAFQDGTDEACISFKDNGIGIDEENLKRLSEPFFTTKTRGTGLGLTVCHQIINLHAGRIEVQSQKGKGSLFKVCLPLKRK